jgi:hypothetical protein
MVGTRVLANLERITYQKLFGANALDDAIQSTLASTQLCRDRYRMLDQRFPFHFSL